MRYCGIVGMFGNCFIGCCGVTYLSVTKDAGYHGNSHGTFHASNMFHMV